MKTKGFIQPTKHDSIDQKMRWMQIQMHHYWWEVTGKKDIQSINRLTQEIRKEWIESNQGRKKVGDEEIIELLRKLDELSGKFTISLENRNGNGYGLPIEYESQEKKMIGIVRDWLER